MRKMTKEEFFESFKNQTYVNQLMEIPQKFNVVHNEEEKRSNITIYGVIGSSFWGDSFSATDLDNALKGAEGHDIIVNLNSPGGDAFMGIAMYNRLKRHNGKVTIMIDGWACSAASVLAQAGDEVIMGLGSMFMIHEASSVVWGSKTEFRKEAEVLEELEEGIIDIYMTNAAIDRDEVRQKVDAETWMSAKTAVNLGFATKAEGVGSNDNLVGSDGALNTHDKQNIMNELKSILNQNKSNQEPSLVPVNSAENRTGSLNLLKKRR